MRTKFGYRTLEATYLVACWPGSTSNAISGPVGRWRHTGQEAVNRALYHGLIENRGTDRRFELYVTTEGLAALDNAWPLFANDAASWTPDQTLEHIDQVLAKSPIGGSDGV